MSETQCRKSSPQTNAPDGRKMLCDCLPAQIKKLQSTLPQKDLKTKHSESSFSKQYLTTLIGSCGAEHFRSTYSEGCPARFSARANGTQYCACMYRYVAQLADADAVQIGSDAADYLPLAADAKKRDLPAPEQPASLKKMAAAESACTAEAAK